MRIVAYPGTFDPLTLGHESIIRRTVGIFDKIVIAVARGVHKQPLFALEERVEMVSEVLAPYGDKVKVLPVEGLLANFLTANNIRLILRGMRSVSDFEFEIQLADINRRLGNNVETLFMAPDTDYIHVYSHFVRELAMLGGDTSAYVNETIARRLAALYQRKSSN